MSDPTPELDPRVGTPNHPRVALSESGIKRMGKIEIEKEDLVIGAQDM